MKITLYEELPMCPDCEIGMEFQETVNTLHIKDGEITFRPKYSLYKCSGCNNIYKVEKNDRTNK